MTTPQPPADIWARVSVRWKDLARIAAIVATILGSVFIPPPAYMTESGEGTLVPFARYSVAIVTALVTVAMMRWDHRAHLRRWLAASIVAFLLVVASYFSYNDRRDALTAIGPDGARVVIGSEYTTLGRAATTANPLATPEQLLDDAPCATGGSACSARLIWSASSIAGNKRLLGVLFLLGAVLLDVALLAAVQCTLI